MKIGVAVLAVGWLMWLICVAVIGDRVVSNAVDYKSGFSCPLPRDDSQYGKPSWGWWPPGETCSYKGRTLHSPQQWRSDALVAIGAGLLILPAFTVVLARRHRESAGEYVELEELVGT